MNQFQMAIGQIIQVNSSNLTETTLKYLVGIAREQRKDPLVRRTVENIMAGAAEKNWEAEIQKIFNYVKAKMRYTRDINGVETVSTPTRHLQEIAERGITFGDCDDASLLLATLLESAGYKSKFVIVRTPGNPYKTFNHIYVESMNPYTRKWYSLDATEKGRPFDWSCPNLAKKEYMI